MNTLATLHRAPGVGLTQYLDMPIGLSVAEIATLAHGSADSVTAWLRAPAGAPNEWFELPRAMWGWVKPKVADVLMFCFRPSGGSLGNIFKIAATIITLIAAPYLTPIIGGLATGLLSAAFLAGTSYLANKLFPTATETLGGALAAAPEAETARALASVTTDSNILAKEAALPLVVGTRRISPPEIAAPHTYLEDGIQSLNRIFALDGHHGLTDVQVDGSPIGDYDSITTEVRDGSEATTVSAFVDKVTSSVAISGSELPGFSTDGVALEDQETPVNSVPRWTRFSTRYHAAMEEVTIRLQLDSFLKSDSASADSRLPLRLRFRPKGSTGSWTNLPEIHLSGRDPQTSLKEIRLRWDESFGGFDTGGEITYDFFQNVPPAANVLTSGATGDQWQAASHFVAGAGLTDVQNISGRRHGLRVVLDETVTPKAEFEWEIIRGAASQSSSFATSTYKLSSTVYSLFEGQSISAEWRTPVDQGVYLVRIRALQATVLVDQQPCQRPATAVLALKSKGQSVRNVTVLAKNYVLDWDGAAWATLTRSTNPAVQYRHILQSYLAYHGIDTSLITDADFVAWRQECIDRGYQVSAVFAGAPVAEVLASIAEAGFARASFSDGYSIDYFRDRTSERPAITFSPRNASISVKWLAPEAPSGIRAKFQNEADGYRDDEVQVSAPGYTNFPGQEVVDYKSIASRELVRRRALFDILQRQYHGRRVWTVETSIEGALCERGTLVGLVTDLTDDVSFGARVREVIDSTHIKIDQDIPAAPTTSVYGETNVFTLGNIFESGEQTALLISTPTGTEMRTVVAAEARVIRVDAPFLSLDLEGAHLVMAPISRFTRRCIVSEVARRGEENATLTLVDEAPEIESILTEQFG